MKSSNSSRLPRVALALSAPSAPLTTAALALGLVALVNAAPAQAYLDPGTGSMIVQLVMGGVAGAMVLGKLYWQRVKSALGFSSAAPLDSEGNKIAGGSKAAETDAD